VSASPTASRRGPIPLRRRTASNPSPKSAPFAPWSEILRELVRQTPAPAGTAEWPDVLARLTPAVTRYWGRAACPPSPAPELERARLFEAVGELIAWSALDRPVLLVLDDLHLADAASMALLAYLGRRLPEQPAFVLGTRRGAPASARLDATVEGLDRRGIMAPELVLAPLPARAVRAIVSAAAPALAAEELARLVSGSDGNPLLASQAARAVIRGGQPLDGLRSMVRGPLSRLSPPARLLVDIAHRRELLVLEDNPYGLLRYEGVPQPTLRSLDAIHLATAQVLTNESGTALIAFVTYDRRLLECAKAAGLPTASPGQN